MEEVLHRAQASSFCWSIGVTANTYLFKHQSTSDDQLIQVNISFVSIIYGEEGGGGYEVLDTVHFYT